MQTVKMHHRWIIPLLMFLGFFLDGSLSLIFGQYFYSDSNQMAPQLFLLAIVMVTFADLEDSPLLFWYALVAGVAYDLFYTGLIGQYMLLAPLTYLLSRYLLQYFLKRPIYVLSAFVISIVASQVILYGLALFFKMGSLSLGLFLINVLAPTIILNVGLFLIFYWPGQYLLHFLVRDFRR